MINGLLCKIRTGADWRDAPERDGPWQTLYQRYRRWSADGTWNRLLAHVQVHDDAIGVVDWSAVCVDATIMRAHQHAAGARHPRQTEIGRGPHLPNPARKQPA